MEEEIIKCGHVESSIIQTDINETQQEIDRYELGLVQLMKNPLENKMSIMSYEVKILKRKNFVEKLNEILNYRKEH